MEYYRVVLSRRNQRTEYYVIGENAADTDANYKKKNPATRGMNVFALPVIGNEKASLEKRAEEPGFKRKLLNGGIQRKL